ncbi:O-methyltransferase lepI [Lachnellula suecica]|uniref:O-methyltransferase lepI n=1 Tax=Lachnellula suecica TaxID=602035 RepID=A0A8T9BWA0_9HELO|nr:O-methyltransferase lepI [Lachnellula suecica]
MEELIAKAREEANSANENGRKQLLDSLRNLSYEIETPQDTMQRIMFMHVETTVIRIAYDLRLFKILVGKQEPATVTALAEEAKATTGLMGRLLRYLSSVGCIKEVDKDTFESNNITQTLAMDGVQGGVQHLFDTFGPVFQVLPDFLKDNHYHEITDVANTPLQKAFNTKLPAFLWIQTMPSNFAHFNNWMMVQHMGMPVWLDVYPYQDQAEAIKNDVERAFFVDVGGGLGHQSIALRNKVPDLKNKILLQEQQMVLQFAIDHPGVEKMPYDFYTEQPVKGAKIYYLRNIIHDYPNEKATVILKNLVAALAEDSIILIDDMVIPDTNAHRNATQLDICMMAGLASIERTREAWHELIESVGLKINRIYTYTASLRDSIIECVK